MLFENNNKILVIGEKETFIIKVLIGKLKDAGITAIFAPTDVNDINKEWGDSGLITYYLEAGEHIPGDIATFLKDKLSDNNKQLAIIGDATDTKMVVDNFPPHVIYKVFARPLDYSVFISDVSLYFNMVAEGEMKKSILIVDDDPNYMGLVREWIKDTYKVSMANSGLRAIKWLGSNKVDLILLDYEMPVTDGPQVLEMLRSDEETKSIPVIFLTGKDDKESVMSVLALKPEGYILKTSGKNEIINTISKFFVNR
ncbi:response regulator [Butyrivibrio sp. VCB2006]|uniref:response regulator n=1 Tax=Butyrivibrio sp. VCB2006 TaxID=1280679 RepID=UPI000420986F|nr:response regulator [Butyrivibrio sp. VCB2006]